MCGTINLVMSGFSFFVDRGGRGLGPDIFLVIIVFQRVAYGPPSCSIASQVESVLDFQRRPGVTWHFPGGPGPMSPLPTLDSPKMVIFGRMFFLALFVFLYVLFSCVLSLSHVLSCVRCGTWLYRFLTSAFHLTLLSGFMTIMSSVH